MPELITAGFVGYVTLETHSLHDLMNITATLEAVRQSVQDRPNGLQGIEFVLRRKKERISTPDGKGGRASREKWLVSIEPVPSWAQTYLAMASSTLAIDAPRVDMLTGEVMDDEDEDDTIEGEYTETQPAQPATNEPAQAATPEDAEHDDEVLPFSNQYTAVKWATDNFSYYQKGGKPDLPHAVGSITKLCKEIGYNEKEFDCWGGAWMRHVLSHDLDAQAAQDS